MLREEALLRELEDTLGKLVEWRGFALKLKQDNEYLMVERDRLKEAAGKAPRPSESHPNGSSKDVFKMIKALLSKGLHPDTTSDALEKKIRTKLFQELWPQINDLESHA
jgi:hypothetical protein